MIPVRWLLLSVMAQSLPLIQAQRCVAQSPASQLTQREAMADLLGCQQGMRLCAVGVAKTDVTPKHPVVLAGYGSRNREHEGIDPPPLKFLADHGTDELA